MFCCASEREEDSEDFYELYPTLDISQVKPHYKTTPAQNQKTNINNTNTKVDNSINNIDNENYTIKERQLKHDYSKNISLYPWLELKCFDLSLSSKGKEKLQNQTQYTYTSKGYQTHPYEYKNQKYLCLKIINKNSISPEKIIIFSNGEMSNLCGILPFLIDLCTFLRINIFLYEYPKISVNYKDKQKFEQEEEETYEENSSTNYSNKEIIICTQFIVSFICSDPLIKNISLMGFSLGCFYNYSALGKLLFTKGKLYEKLKNVINISPMWCDYENLSGSKYGYDWEMTKKIFKKSSNRKFLKKLIEYSNKSYNFLTFVVHGMKDIQIGYVISMKICMKIKNKIEFYPHEVDHCNLVFGSVARKDLLEKLKVIIVDENKDLLKKSFGSSYFKNNENESKYFCNWENNDNNENNGNNNNNEEEDNNELNNSILTSNFLVTNNSFDYDLMNVSSILNESSNSEINTINKRNFKINQNENNNNGNNNLNNNKNNEKFYYKQKIKESFNEEESAESNNLKNFENIDNDNNKYVFKNVPLNDSTNVNDDNSKCMMRFDGDKKDKIIDKLVRGEHLNNNGSFAELDLEKDDSDSRSEMSFKNKNS